MGNNNGAFHYSNAHSNLKSSGQGEGRGGEGREGRGGRQTSREVSR